LCLSSFLNHFGAPPSYRPRFNSKWYLSLGGFVMSVWVMFMINPFYTILSYIIIVVLYLFIEHNNKDTKGIVSIFKGALFQLNRKIQIYMQKHQSNMDSEEWRPATLCVSPHSFDRDKVFEIMKWISYRHGFGTYFHFIEGYFGRQTYAESQKALQELVEQDLVHGNTLYLDTMISPSYTSAIAQAIQAPSISGMENNMVLFEYEKHAPEEIERILDNISLVKSGNFDVCVYAQSDRKIRTAGGIHVWVRDADESNTNFMILLGYIIMSHPDWKHSRIKIFITSRNSELSTVKHGIEKRIAAGRLPITMFNTEIVVMQEEQSFSEVVAQYSQNAALTLIGFKEEYIKNNPMKFFTDFAEIGDIVFVSATQEKEIM
jgi:hypothetical protein